MMKNWIQNIKTAFADKAELRVELDGCQAALKQLDFNYKAIDNERRDLAEKSAERRAHNLALKDQSARLNDRVTCYEEEIRKLKAKLRPQNEADLYLLSAQIQKRIMDGEPVKPADGQVLAQAALMNQLGMQRPSIGPPHFMPYPYNHPFGG